MYPNVTFHVYAQVSGLPMGSPLSPGLTNLYMKFYETAVVHHIIDFDIIWYRYADDVFAVVPDPLNIDNFSKRHRCITFKAEAGHNTFLPFLDVMVIC